MFKYFLTVILSLLLVACVSSEVQPETTAQMQVVSYAELTALTIDVTEACESRILSKNTCVDMYESIQAAKLIIDTGVGMETAADIMNKIKEKL